MRDVRVVVSGKGGVGKTALVSNLGAAFAARYKKRVLLIDADIGLRNLDIALGTEGKIVFDLCDVADGRCAPEKAVVTCDDIPGLFLLPSPAVNCKFNPDPEKMERLCGQLLKFYDMILVDAPAGLGSLLEFAVAAADSVIVVTTPDYTAVRDADKCSDALERLGKTDLSLVINRVRPGLILRGKAPDIDQMMDGVSLSLLGVIPEDEAVMEGMNCGRPASLGETPSSVAVHNIAARLMGENAPLYRFWRKKRKAFT